MKTGTFAETKKAENNLRRHIPSTKMLALQMKCPEMFPLEQTESHAEHFAFGKVLPLKVAWPCPGKQYYFT